MQSLHHPSLKASQGECISFVCIHESLPVPVKHANHKRAHSMQLLTSCFSTQPGSRSETASSCVSVLQLASRVVADPTRIRRMCAHGVLNDERSRRGCPWTDNDLSPRQKTLATRNVHHQKYSTEHQKKQSLENIR